MMARKYHYLAMSVSLSVSAVKSKTHDGVIDALVSVKPEAQGSRTPIDVVCVIDVSGSMETNAANNDGETSGLTVLDIVKHGVKTIIHCLKENDRVSIVKYSNNASVVLQLTQMNSKESKDQALAAVSNLRTEGCTNLWDGLLKGLDVLRVRRNTSRPGTVMLLTDGLPNVEPPLSHLDMLKQYKDNNPFPCSVNTFGFGYSLDSILLKELAVEGKGAYSFIPDSTFVGTCFINSVSNLLSTMAWNATLSIEVGDGFSLEQDGVLGGYQHTMTSWGVLVDVGSVKYGQSRDVLVSVRGSGQNEESIISVTLKHSFVKSGEEERVSEDLTPSDIGDSLDHSLEVERCRLLAVDAIREAFRSMKASSSSSASLSILNDAITAIKESPVAQDERIVALLEDLEGQATESFTKKAWFDRWGQHYVPSLIGAHLNQECNNFKDPGVQVYGGELFQEIRDEGDAIFCELPPPEPDLSAFGGYAASYAAPAPTSMRSYHNRSAPCFHPECLVVMADGSKKQVQYVRKGDCVLNGQGESVRVECVIKTHCTDQRAKLVSVPNSSLIVTEWHPVRLSDCWYFPSSLAPAVVSLCPAVYSFLLESSATAHSMMIGGVEVITLAHGVKLDPVASHSFFGTERVRTCLSAFRGFAAGLIELSDGCTVLDLDSGIVSDISLSSEIVCSELPVSELPVYC